MQKTHRVLAPKLWHEAFQRVKNETLQESHSKFGTMDKAQNFWIQNNKPHGIMEDRISFQKQKMQLSSFKITTCETFQKVKNDTS